MPTEYFEITLEGQDVTKQLYNDDDQDLLRPWYSALSDIYGMKTNNYDGYMSKAFINNTNMIKLICYVLDDDVKTASLKNNSVDWKKMLVTHVESAIKTHIERLNIRFEKVLVIPSLVSWEHHQCSHDYEKHKCM
jgi:hypothetical protein